MATTFTATLPDGTTRNRTSQVRTYTHCIAVPDGRGGWYANSWAGSPALAAKAAARSTGSVICEATVAHAS